MSKIIEELDAIAKVSGKKDKQDMMTLFLRDSDYRVSVVEFALNPFKMFGIKDPIAADVLDLGYDRLEEILNRLLTRQDTGNDARRLAGRFVDQELMRRILIKDLRCGVGITTINKIMPKLLPTFAVPLAEKYDSEVTPLPAFISPKIDGLRIITIIVAGVVKFYSRNGLEQNSLDHLIPGILELTAGWGDIVLDGEATDGLIFNDAVSGIKTKDTSKHKGTAIYHIFDAVPYEVFRDRKPSAEQEVRLESLALMFGTTVYDHLKLVKHSLVADHAVVMRMNDEFRAGGLEGSIIKHRTAPYQFKRSAYWSKIKGKETYDCAVIGKIAGNPGTKYENTLGALQINFNGNKVKVGSGFSDEERNAFWAEPPEVIEVSCHEVTEYGSLRHPVFNKVRLDLNASELSTNAPIK